MRQASDKWSITGYWGMQQLWGHTRGQDLTLGAGWQQRLANVKVRTRGIAMVSSVCRELTSVLIGTA